MELPLPLAVACLGANTAAAYVGHALDEQDIARVDEHIDRCAECRQHLSELALDEAAPARVGRYVIETPIGQGGMGVVYRAHDPELGRSIALKMIRAGVDTTRLVREARAMAQLAHPNVVRVFDLVVTEPEEFIAMELIAGPTLRTWLAIVSRTWREILNAFRAAGEGLAAAHRAGLVHRDFKPENVLVDEFDGRVCVTDFGLVSDERGVIAGASLTKTSGLLGTPAYMAPEQYRREPTDARTDQFSFCVALWEALYGEPAFEGDDLHTRAEAVIQGRLRPHARSKNVPGWIRPVLLRGMRVASAERYPSMTALLAALERDPAQRWRRIALAVVAPLAVASSILAFRPHAIAPRPSADARLAGVWDAPRKQAVERGLLGTDKQYAADAWRGTARVLDGYAAEWKTAYTEANAVRINEPEKLRRIACLEDRLLELRAFTDALEHPNRGLVNRAVTIAESLTPISTCSGAVAISPLPTDPSTLATVLGIRQELGRLKVLHEARSRDELALAERVAENARKTGYAPIIAHALYRLGLAYDVRPDAERAMTTLREAAAIADASGDDTIRARALSTLLRRASEHGKVELADELRTQAISLVDRLKDGGEVLQVLDLSIGLSFIPFRRFDEAEPWLEKGRLEAERAFGKKSARTALAFGTLGYVKSMRGRNVEALALEEQALEILRETIGPEHPETVVTRAALAFTSNELLRSAEAEAYARAALRTVEREWGPNCDNAADVLAPLGTALSDQNRHAEAFGLFERSLAIKEKVLRSNDPDLTESLVGLGREALAQRKPAIAVTALERVLKLNPAGKTMERAEAEFLLADALHRLHRQPARVRELATHARAAYRAAERSPRQERDFARFDRLGR